MDEKERQEINRQIDLLRKGDKQAEEFLYERYRKLIRNCVYKSSWSNEIWDLEDTIKDIIQHVWLKLREYFMTNHIDKNEKAVVYHKVAPYCRKLGKEYKRERTVGDDQYLLDVETEKTSDTTVAALIGKCLDRLAEIPRKVLVLHIYRDMVLREIAQKLGLKGPQEVHEYKKEALLSLTNCLMNHGVRAESFTI